MSDQIRDSLDDAIDRVATSLVSVQADPHAVDRIVSSLPPRHERRWWGVSSLPLQAVALAAVVVAVVYVRSSIEEGRRSPESASLVATITAEPMNGLSELRLAARRDDVRESVPSALSSVALARPDDAAPFGLAAIDAPEQMSLPTLQTMAPLAAVEPASVAPLALSELPLASDVPPPFSQE